MEATSNICCMCGDVGFSDKIFQCSRCVSRFQHSYCTNFYQEQASSETTSVCDWCLSEQRRNSRHGSHSKKPALVLKDSSTRREQSSAEKSKSSISSVDREEGSSRGKSSASSTPSSGKPAGRRYKLLKDVLC